MEYNNEYINDLNLFSVMLTDICIKCYITVQKYIFNV